MDARSNYSIPIFRLFPLKFLNVADLALGTGPLAPKYSRAQSNHVSLVLKRQSPDSMSTTWEHSKNATPKHPLLFLLGGGAQPFVFTRLLVIPMHTKFKYHFI